MTRKDYTVLAQALREMRKVGTDGAQWRAITVHVAVRLKETNSGMNVDRFLKASGVHDADS